MTSPATAPQPRQERRVASPGPSPGEWLPSPGHTDSCADPDWLKIAGALDARIVSLEARLQRATAELESGALARLHQSFGEAIVQARERIKRYATACGESRLVDLEAELERRLEPFLNRSQAAINDLERLLETFRQEQAAWETRTVRQHRQDGAPSHPDTVGLRLQRLSESLQARRAARVNGEPGAGPPDSGLI